MGFKLFISHLSKDKESAKIIKDALKPYGIESFVAHEDIPPMDLWLPSIDKNLKEADAVLALITPGFKDSFWTNQEIGITYGLDKRFIAVSYIENPVGVINIYQAIKSGDITIMQYEEKKGLIFKIIDCIIKDDRTFSIFIDNYFHALSNCEQYNESTKWARILPMIKENQSITKNQIETLIKIYNENSQAYDNRVLNGGHFFEDEFPLIDYINSWYDNEKYKFDRHHRIIES